MIVIYLTEPKKAAPDKKSYAIGAANSLSTDVRATPAQPLADLWGALQLPDRPDIRRTVVHRHATQLNRGPTHAGAIEMPRVGLRVSRLLA
ncbi:hypothetical protein LMA00_26015 [Burkholderia ambifaria]|uniref:hypothetical protein n=1 Tax=Burkholderia ambifaria TaxID=152480 RepID=UPI001E52D2E2|nr:hypothetical protein [Burkholderia ambifaria]UEP50451.1 hypothetical protein LMA00_26015 [Burkholderia ambifaria]